MHFNLFSGVLFGMAFVAVLGAGAYKSERREALTAAGIFTAIGTALLWL